MSEDLIDLQATSRATNGGDMSDAACWILIGLGAVLMFTSDGYGSDALAMIGVALLLVGFWTLVLS